MPLSQGADDVRVKQCRDCGAVKSLEEFYLNPGSAKGTRGGDGRRSRCIPCYKEFILQGKDKERQRKQQREKRRKDREADPEFSWRSNLRRYGLTPETYKELLESQGGVCAICKVSECSSGTRFSVDHDHKCCPQAAHVKKLCGKCVRGLLCRQCNIGIGALKESEEIMNNAIKYLNRVEEAE